MPKNWSDGRSRGCKAGPRLPFVASTIGRIILRSRKREMFYRHTTPETGENVCPINEAGETPRK